jgi:hypothetical protein
MNYKKFTASAQKDKFVKKKNNIILLYILNGYFSFHLKQKDSVSKFVYMAQK